MKRRELLKKAPLLGLPFIPLSSSAEELDWKDNCPLPIRKWHYGGPDNVGIIIHSPVQYGHPAFTHFKHDYAMTTGHWPIKRDNYDHLDNAEVIRAVSQLPKDHPICKKYQIEVVSALSIRDKDCFVWYDACWQTEQ